MWPQAVILEFEFCPITHTPRQTTPWGARRSLPATLTAESWWRLPIVVSRALPLALGRRAFDEQVFALWFIAGIKLAWHDLAEPPDLRPPAGY